MSTPSAEFPEHSDLPLRDRLPEYAAMFGLGVAVAVILGFVVNRVEGIGYALLFLGIGCLMFGGATGGGYTSWGPSSMARMFGRDIDEGDGRSLEERARRRARPEASPTAFWSVVAGLLYVTAGFSLLT